MSDDDVLRFAPPEIRRLWKHLVNLEGEVAEVRASLARIEEALRSRGPG
jgi:hypothetical protein